MNVIETEDDTRVSIIFNAWLADFGRALEQADVSEVVQFFADDSYWKDILSFTWGYRTFGSKPDIANALEKTIADAAPRNIRPAVGRTAPRQVRRSAKSVIEAYFDFDTAVGHGTGFVRLLHDEGSSDAPLIWILLTTLQELDGFEERVGKLRPSGEEYSHSFSGDNWLDRRLIEQAFENNDPDVLVVGAGQAGLILGARLGQLGLRTLIVEKNERVGDNWRKRYHSLTLHNEVWANSLPYMPFPETWPTFLPKDKLAGWLEGYAEFMDLNVWTSTEFLGAEFDSATKTWSARVTRAGGKIRELTTKHVVLASGGTSGIPNLPKIAGIDDFTGTVMHSSQFFSGKQYAGKKALVIGTGNSGHDVAQDMYSNGAEVTIMQRNPTCVVSLVPSGTMVYAVYSEGPPVDDVDLVTAAIPYPVLQSTYQYLTKKTSELDSDLLSGLESAGFRTDSGPDQTGFHMLFLRRGGGYYINVGCSDLIINGSIALVQAADSDRFVDTGLRMNDGSIREYDVIVLATGYKNQQEGIRRMFGDDVADKVGPVWGFDENYIMRNMWQRTGQENFWIMGGSLLDCRLYSRFLALQIKADIEGLSEPDVAPPSTAFEDAGDPVTSALAAA